MPVVPCNCPYYASLSADDVARKAKASAASKRLSAKMGSEALAPFSDISAHHLFKAARGGMGASALAAGSVVLLHQELGSTKRTRNASQDLHWGEVTPDQKRKLAEEIETASRLQNNKAARRSRDIALSNPTTVARRDLALARAALRAALPPG